MLILAIFIIFAAIGLIIYASIKDDERHVDQISGKDPELTKDLKNIDNFKDVLPKAGDTKRKY